MKRGLAIVAAVLLLGFSASACEDALREDLAAIQGKWATRVTDQNGNPVLAVKEIKGNKETYTLFKGEEIVLKREVEFKLSRADNKVRIFTAISVTSIKGPEEGRTFDVEQAYIYKVEDDVFVEVDGLLLDKNFEGVPSQLVRWLRVKEKGPAT